MANMIGRAEELTRQERKTLRAQIRALRKQAMGIRLCGARRPALCGNGAGERPMPNARVRPPVRRPGMAASVRSRR